ncbi:MAG: hypothetical protein K2N48_05775 [Muribaculaceae bacterium]|nr:hypothetical protein [Muribaculaceae bacterium]
MADSVVIGTNIVRIAELEAIPVNLLADPKNNLWGVLETEDRVYKFDLREILKTLDGKDPRVDAILTRLNELEEAAKSFMYGTDENEMIEP